MLTAGSALYTYETVEAIHVEPSNQCNATCPMCPRFTDNGSKVNPNIVPAEITLEQWKRYFPPDLLARLRYVHANGHFGEPTLAKELLAIFQYTREINPRVGLRLNTNGSTRTTDWWREMGKLLNGSGHPDICNFGVDGLGDTNALYRRNTRFEKIVENMKAFCGAGGQANWSFIAFKHNEHQVDDVRRLATELGFALFTLKRTTRWERIEDGRGVFPVKDRSGKVTHWLEQPEGEELRDGLLDSMLEAAPRDESKPLKPVPSTTFDLSQNPIKCRFVHRSRGGASDANKISLTANGHLFPCQFLAGEPWNPYGDAYRDMHYVKMLELSGGIDAFSLERHSLQEILELPIFKHLMTESFAPGHPLRARNCTEICPANGNWMNGEFGTRTMLPGWRTQPNSITLDDFF